VFLVGEDFATDINRHVIFQGSQKGEITGYWVEKYAKVSF
jgi:hypothetical protein